MKKTLLSTAIAAVLSATAFSAMAEDAPPASPLTFNVGIVSDYLFRGISQTHGDAAVQGGIDYAFSNGFYIGTWASSISWVSDWLGKGSVEVDLYGGYKNNITEDLSFDVGVIGYLYPGKEKAIPQALANPNTTEVYGALTYKWLTAKYSRTVSSHFVGWYGGPNLDQDTRGSGYFELNAAYDLGNGWGLQGHLGHQKVKNSVTTVGTPGAYDASYTDYKVGFTKDVGFGTFGLAYSHTNAKGSCSGATVSAYCWGELQGMPGGVPNYTNPKNVAESKAVVSFLKTF